MKSGRLFVFVLLMGLTASAACAEEAAAPAMDAEKTAQMEKAKALMAPGEAHKALESFAGKWTTVSRFWMSPDAPPEESAGSNEAELIYGGRFLKETYKGTWMGQPFEGIGYTGHDNVKGEYQSVWIDSSATSIMNSTGVYDAAAKTFTFNGTSSCPMTGQKDMKMRMVHVLADNSHTLTGYMTGTDGKEAKGMEIVYTRAA